MKAKYSLRSFIALTGSAILSVSFSHAGQIWDGSGGDNNWNTLANWDNDTLPGFGSAITFQGNTRNNAVNNLTVNSTIGGINFTNTGSTGFANAFTLSGNAITLGGNITTTASSSAITDTISLNMILNGDRTITTHANHDLAISGAISQDASNRGLIKAGTGTLTLSGDNTYAGSLTIQDGIVKAGKDSASGSAGPFGNTGSAAIILANVATAGLDINGFNVSVKDLQGGGAAGGNVTLTTGKTLSILNPASGSAIYNGLITGGGNLLVNGSSRQTLNGASTYTGTTTLTGTVSLRMAIMADGGQASSIGAAGNAASNLVLNSGIFEYNNTLVGNTSRLFTLGGNVTIQTNGTGAMNFTNTGAIVVNGGAKTLILTTSSTGNGSIAASIGDGSGATGITKAGTNTWTLSHNGSNFTGTITLNTTTSSAGTLAFASAGGANAITFNQTTGSASLSYIGSGQTMSGAITANALSTGTITLDASGSGAINYSHTGSLGNGGASGNKALVLSGTNTGNNILSGQWVNNTAGGAATLTKSGSGKWVLTGNNTHTGGTNVNGGTLLLSGAINMPTSGTLAVAAGGIFSLADGTVRNTTAATLTLATGSLLNFDWSSVGTVDNLAPTVAITPAAGAAVGIIINPLGGTPTGGGNLLTGIAGSTLNNPNYFLANNTNFTATINKPVAAGAGSVSIGSYAPVSALTNAYWKRNQVTGATDTMAFSSGTTSNWASNAAGTSAGGVVPGGSGVNVIFGSNTAGSSAVTVGADMNLGSITFNDTVSYTISGNSVITLNNSSGTAASTTAALATVTAGSAISVTSFANATNAISAHLALGANQTWNVASGKTLAVSGIVSGGFSLTKADAGTLTLSGVNNYSGGTTLAAGAINYNTTGALGSGSLTLNGTGTGVVLANGTALANNVTMDSFSVAAGSGLFRAADGQSATLSGTITINGGGAHFGAVGATGTGTLNITGAVNSASTTVAVRSGTAVFFGGGSYANIRLNQGTLRLGASNGLSTSTTVDIAASAAGNFDLAGFNQTVAGITKSGVSTGIIGNSSTTTDSTLTTTGTSSFSGVIQDSLSGGTRKVALTVNGNSLELSNANTFTGNTTVNAGTLTFSGSGALSNAASTVSVASGAQIVASASTNNVLGFASARIWNISGTFNSSGGGAQTMPGTVTLNNGTLTGVSNATFGTYLNNASYTTTITANGANNTISAGNVGMGGTNALLFSTPLATDALSVSSTLGNASISPQTGALTKSGLGTLTLSGTVANAYSGATTVNGGILALNKTAGVNAIAGAITLGDGATTAGNDVLRLDANNQIADATVITFNAATGTNAGILRLNNRSETVAGIASTAGGGMIENESGSAGTAILTVNNSAAQSFSGIIRDGDGTGIDGTLALTKLGAGTLILSGNNSYTGTTTINAGTLELDRNGGALANTGAVVLADFAGATLLLRHDETIGSLAGGGATGGTVDLNGKVLTIATGMSIDTLFSGQITGASGSGLIKTGDGKLTLANPNNPYGGNTSVLGGTLSISNYLSMGSTSGATFFLDNNSTLETTANINNESRIFNVGANGGRLSPTAGTTLLIGNTTGYLEGSGTLTKIGAGTLILDNGVNPNTHTGAILVNEGKLLINGSTTASSAITVANAATLGGSGTVGGSVTIESGGTYSPGNSIESLASGNLSLLANAVFAQEIDKFATPGQSGDLSVVTGTLGIASGAMLTLTELGTSGSWNEGDKFTLIGYSSGTWNGGLFTYLGSTLDDDSTFTFSGVNWLFDYNDTAFGDNYQSDMTSFTSSARYVTMTAIPEPSAALLAGLGSLLLLYRRRH